MTGIWYLAAFNALILALFYILLIRKTDTRNQSEKLLEDIRKEISQMIVELNSTTDRNIGIIEGKISELTEGIGEADKRLVLLQREFRKRKDTYENLKPRAIPLPEIERPQEDQRKEKKAEKIEGEVQQDIKKTPKEQVIQLHHQGVEPRIIAQNIGMTLGEVELIISINESKGG